MSLNIEKKVTLVLRLFSRFFRKIIPEKLYWGLKRRLLILLVRVGYSNSASRMDLMIVELFKGMKGGFYIEAGAADGVDMSNTLLLEKKYNWTGLLVEPRNEAYLLCEKSRKKSIVENYVLTSFQSNKKTTKVSQNGLYSGVIVEEDTDLNSEYSIKPLEYFNNIYKETDAPTEICKNITLTDLLEQHSIENVDIMSLDVEGYEFEVLEGYDEKSKIINYLIVETDIDEFKIFAKRKGWKLIDHWSGGNNYLFKLR